MTTLNDTCPKILINPIVGAWTLTDFPQRFNLVLDDGSVVELVKSMWNAGRDGAVAVYREPVRENSLHVDVLPNGTFRSDHRDCVNPDEGLFEAADHADKDAGWGGLAKVALAGLVLFAGVKAYKSLAD